MTYTKNPRPVNKCQYWIDKEPIQCVYWNEDNTACTYTKEVKTTFEGKETVFIQRADLYPFCNYIGTAKTLCRMYATELPDENSSDLPAISNEVKARCVLPDPYRHKSMSPNCPKWVTPPTVTTNSSGEATFTPLDYSRISGYNEGTCNFNGDTVKTGGTDMVCTGFSPHNLGIGIAPFQDSCKEEELNKDKVSTKGFPTDSHLPMNYDILNKRAILGRCRWWDSDKYDFTLKQDTKTSRLSVDKPEFKCTNTDVDGDFKRVVEEFSDFYKDEDNLYIRPPCNGAMPECPKYTGNLASTGFLPYLSSVYLRAGDKVLAEQILEIRYNLRKEMWTQEEYNLYFGLEAKIFANEGIPPEIIYNGPNSIKDYTLLAIKTEIDNFICFSIKRTQVRLTKGTSSDSLTPRFPTLIKELKNILFEPIIRSVFETYENKNSDKNIFEAIFETSYSNHEEILLLGDFFGNNSNLFAINLDLPGMDFPFNELIKHKNMYSYRSSFFTNGINDQSAQNQFVKIHEQLVCYFKLLKELSVDKMYFNEWSNKSASFAINVKTIFGRNRIFIFDISSSIYTFAAITINKVFCGGLVAQKTFEVTPNEETIGEIFDYEMQTCFPRFQPKVSYAFKAFKNKNDNIGAQAVHTYLDTRFVENPYSTFSMDSNPTYVLGYKYYKIKVMDKFIVDTSCTDSKSSRLLLLGNEGYVLVVINDSCKLHCVIRNWDSGKIDNNGNHLPIVVYLKGVDAKEKEHSIEMEVDTYCSQNLECNQMILKPKDSKEYVRLYNPYIEFSDGLYVYERWSFGKTPTGDYEELKDYPKENITLALLSSDLEGELSSGEYTLTGIPTYPIIVSIVFKSSLTDRIRGQAKTDLLVWIKKPYCSDVEIMYAWLANYQEIELLPNDSCFVSRIGVRKLKTYVGGYAPGCGDHQFGHYSRRPAPMWYPYTSCDPYATYNLKSGNYENDQSLLEFWLTDTGKPDFTRTNHGYKDLRMLGPAQHFGWTTDTHSSVWACGCDYTYHNGDAISAPWFGGWARIRAGVEGEALYYLVQNGGQAPKFGNKNRPYLLTFRSSVALHYYRITEGGGMALEKKWLPAYEAFSEMDLSQNFTEYPWVNYFNESDYFNTYVSQFGLMMAKGLVNNISINERMLKEDSEDKNSSLKRFRFSEIFISHYITTGMVYPTPRKQYYIGNDPPKPVTAWLTYKDISSDASAGDVAIQWAWREKWKSINRDTFDLRELLRTIPLTTCVTNAIHSKYLSFFDITYLNYTYDFTIKEFRRIPDEGFHNIVWEASIVDPDKPESNLPIHFIIRIDEGPIRVLNPKLKLVTDSADLDQNLLFKSISIEELKKHIDFYKLCKDLPWVNTITCTTDLEMASELNAIDNITDGFIIYDSSTILAESQEDAKKNARDDDRVITYYEDGDKKELFFNRGLYFTPDEDMLRYIPKDTDIINLPYSVKLSKPSNDDSNYSTIDINEFYPASFTYSVKYSFEASSVTFTIKLDKPTNFGYAEIVFLKGREEIDPENKLYNYYHIPEVVIRKSEDDETFEEIATFDFISSLKEENLAFFNKSFDVPNIDQDYMSKLSSSISITFNFTGEDIEFDDDVEHFSHFVFIESIKLYKVFYTDVTEKIEIFERKFNVSVGSYGTYPIHGNASSGSLLYPNPWELSTIYQYDNSTGMVGMSGSTGDFTSGGKTRDRIARKLQEDMEKLEGTYTDFEGKQKELYDDIALAGSETINFTSDVENIFKSSLSNLNVTNYPEWSCTFTNKIIVPLTPVEEKELYYPEGHNWTWDNKSFHDFFNCGEAMHSYATLFDYKWGRISGIYGFVNKRDIFDLYSYGLTDVLTDLANPQESIKNKLGIDDFY